MRREIKVAIETSDDGKLCERCPWQSVYLRRPRCRMFSSRRGVPTLLMTDPKGRPIRCRACLRAEQPSEREGG
jgi:hypothetical protein